jgi:hypothetical protein
MFTLILLFMLMIERMESKKEKRSYVVKRDKLPNEHNLYGYSVFDSTGKQRLYRLKTIYSSTDIMVLVDYPAKNIVANMEGVLLEGKLNVTLSIYDSSLNKWTDGSITEISSFLLKKYPIEWNSKQFVMKNRVRARTSRLYNKSQNKLLAKFARRVRWLPTSPFIYDLTIYIDELPDAACFFAIAVIDHRLFHN